MTEPTEVQRKSLYTFGRKRKHDYVRVFREPAHGVNRVRVQWRENDQLRTESFDDTRKGIAEAKAFAEGVHERLQVREKGPIAPISLRKLFQAHLDAKTTEWRANTLRLLRWRWGKLELAVGRHTPAHLLTREQLDTLKNTLLETHSPNQVRMAIKAVTSVIRWGVDRDLIPPTKVVTYTAKFSKDIAATAPKMAEYEADDRAKVIAQFDPRDARQWRPWALSVLFAYCGPRQHAARHLEWRDIDLDDGTITYRLELDKMGNARVQPMPEPVREAFRVAYGWRLAAGYAGAFVFFRPAKGLRDLANGSYETARRAKRATATVDKPYTYQAYNEALHAAEKRAGVTPVRYRAAHGFRRGISGDIHAKTGSSKKAAEWIGDKSVRIVERHYILTREEELRKTAELVGTETLRNATASHDGEAGPSEPSNEGLN